MFQPSRSFFEIDEIKNRNKSHDQIVKNFCKGSSCIFCTSTIICSLELEKCMKGEIKFLVCFLKNFTSEFQLIFQLPRLIEKEIKILMYKFLRGNPSLNLVFEITKIIHKLDQQNSMRVMAYIQKPHPNFNPTHVYSRLQSI